MERNNNSAQTFIIGAVVGGAIGAALALLYAPKKGTELREDIASKVGDLSGRFRSAVGNVTGTVEEMINEGKELGDQVVQDALSKAKNLIHEADLIIQDARSRVTS